MAVDTTRRPRGAEPITQPGVYDMPADTYHTDPVAGGSLSSSGARRILKAPALYQWDRANPAPAKAHFDIGSAAHTLALGTGPQITVVNADSWRTNAAKKAAADARADGKVPLLVDDANRVLGMADALRAHKDARWLFAPGTGRAEQSLFWVDPVTGVWCRSRVDWLPDTTVDGQLIIPEYKTTRSADPKDLPRLAHEHGYHVQAWFYTAGARALQLSPAPLIVFVFQEKDPPYLVTVVQPTDTVLNLGGLLARKAMTTYAECVASGVWPGYTDDVEWLTLPTWVENQWGDQIR